MTQTTTDTTDQDRDAELREAAAEARARAIMTDLDPQTALLVASRLLGMLADAHSDNHHMPLATVAQVVDEYDPESTAMGMRCPHCGAVGTELIEEVVGCLGINTTVYEHGDNTLALYGGSVSPETLAFRCDQCHAILGAPEGVDVDFR